MKRWKLRSAIPQSLPTAAVIITASLMLTGCPVYTPDSAPNVFVPDNGIAFSNFPGSATLTTSVKVLDFADQNGVSWNATTSAAWLSVTPSGVTGDDLTITANPNGLKLNKLYTATIQVTSSQEGFVSKEQIKVSLWVSNEEIPEKTTLSQQYGNLVADPVRPFIYASDGSDSIDVYNVYSHSLVTSFIVNGTPGKAAVLGRATISNDGKYLYVLDSANDTLNRISLDKTAEQVSWPSDASIVEYARPNGYPVILTERGYAIDATTGQKFDQPMPGMFYGISEISSSLYGNRYCMMNAGLSPYSIGCYNLHVDKMTHTITVEDLGGVPHGTGSNGKDIALNYDGTRAWLVGGAPYAFIEVTVDSAVTVVGYLDGQAYPSAVEVGPDGRVWGTAASYYGPKDFWLYDADGVLIIDDLVAGYAQVNEDRALVVSGDGKVGVTQTSDPRLVFVRGY